jgi:UDP-N-acetylmuramoyl-tripeptide--D-alanyl-D-alanine ligase
MAQLTVEEYLSALDGELIWGTPVDCGGVFTDSRRPLPAGLFLALIGERFDGHDYIEAAGRAGALGAIVDRRRQQKAIQQAVNLAEHHSQPLFLMAVSDTLEALHKLANAHRRKFTGPVIAITGSNGKTSTKEMTAHCLRTQYKVLATERNYNNEVGLPLTLLGLTPEHNICVVEMGMRGLGQIARLAAVAEPNIGVITNIGPVHLELLGDIDNVAAAKSELIQALSPSGVAVLNGDDDKAAAMAKQAKGTVITYGISHNCRLQARNIELHPSESTFQVWFDGEKVTDVLLSLPGEHNVYNALAALAAVLSIGGDLPVAAATLATMAPLPMRLERTALPSGTVLINDAYNASPTSMQVALDVLSRSEGRRVAVLGDMLELGVDSQAQHHEVGRLAVTAGVQKLVVVGKGGKAIAQGALSAGLSPKAIQHYPTAAAASAAIDNWLHSGDCVLVKASRGVRLEQVAEAVIRKR